ncbi:MAG: redoxin [Salinisphaeraceae bacterium]|nr:redoxin [Salinisphaeraceae bacterium]
MLSVQLGPLALGTTQVSLLLAMVAALSAGAVAGHRRGVVVSNTLFGVALSAAVAARAIFVLRYADQYGSHPLALVDLRDGGLDAWGGLAGAVGYAAWTSWRKPAIRGPLAIALLAGAIGGSLMLGWVRMVSSPDENAPTARLTTLAGPAVELLEYQRLHGSRPMVVNLWATWCPPCREEMPLLESAQKARADVLFVFANQGESRDAIRTFLTEQALALDHVLLDPEATLGRAAGSTALPTTLFYDAEGRLADAHLGLLSQATLTHRLKSITRAPEAETGP